MVVLIVDVEVELDVEVEVELDVEVCGSGTGSAYLGESGREESRCLRRVFADQRLCELYWSIGQASEICGGWSQYQDAPYHG